ncbi:MAG: hypothetical protein ACOY93_03720 [Bacillota bacterium]
MRNENNGFVTGMVAGAALGALMVMALTPQARRPVMEGMNRMMENRMMRRMVRRGGDMMEAMVPGDAE